MMKLPGSLCFVIFFLFVIESGFSQDNSIDSDEKVKKFKSLKKESKDQKKVLQKAKVKLLNKDQKEDITSTSPSTSTSTTTQGSFSAAK